MYLTHVMVSMALLSVVACGSDDPTAPSDPLTQGLVASYDFETDASDQTGSGNDGTLLGNATITNGALVTGYNDMDALSLPATIVDGLGDFTFAGWVKMTRLHNSQWISCATAADDNSLGIYYLAGDDRWGIDILGARLSFAVNNVMEDADWHHIAVTRSGTSVSLYVDGAFIAPALTVSGDPLDVDNGGFIVGQDQDSLGGGFAADNSMSGEADDLRIYARALSAADVMSLYSLGR
jgi:hypothetical protein